MSPPQEGNDWTKQRTPTLTRTLGSKPEGSARAGSARPDAAAATPFGRCCLQAAGKTWFDVITALPQFPENAAALNLAPECLDGPLHTIILLQDYLRHRLSL